MTVRQQSASCQNGQVRFWFCCARNGSRRRCWQSL